MEDQKIKEHPDKHKATHTRLNTHYPKKQTCHHRPKMEQLPAQLSQPNGRSNHLLVVVDEQSHRRHRVKCATGPADWLTARLCR